MVCENCLHRFVCEDRYEIEEQFGCRYHNCKENIIIAEIEKIKAEIEQDAFKDVNGSKYIFVNRVNQIIENRISELKGEKNE